jgi:hypothetical protein
MRDPPNRSDLSYPDAGICRRSNAITTRSMWRVALG